MNFCAKKLLSEFSCFSELAQKCGCVDDISYNKSRLCTLHEYNATTCVDRLKAAFNPNRDCDCPNECNAERYDVTITDLDWPTKRAFSQFLASFHRYMRNDYSRRLLVDALDQYKDEKTSLDRHSVASIKATFGRFSVFFSDISVTVIEERPVYSFVLVVSHFGRLLGLYLGFSVLTVLELFDFGFDLLEYLRLKGKHLSLGKSERKTNSVLDQENFSNPSESPAPEIPHTTSISLL